MTCLPESEDRGQIYDALANATCNLSGLLCSMLCRSTDTAAEFAERFFREYVRYHGVPSKWICDRDPKSWVDFTKRSQS